MYEPPPGPHALRSPKRSLLGSVLLNGSLALLAVAIALATFLAIAPPTDLVRERLTAELKARTGRDLAIEGTTRFTFLPTLGISAERVSLSAPPSMGGPPLIVADRLEVSLAALPLLVREVRVDRLVLTRPVIDLRIDGTGRRNWHFADAGWDGSGQRLAQAVPRGEGGRRLPAEAEAFVQNATNPLPPPSSKLAGLKALRFGDVRIVDGRIGYADARSGTRYSFDKVDAELALPDVLGPLQIKGAAIYMGEPFKVSSSVASFRDLLDAQPTKLTLDVSGRPMQATWDGVIEPGAGGAGEGRIAIKTASAASLTRMLGFDLTGAEGMGASIEGQLKAQPQAIAFSSMKLALGDLTAQGRVNVDLSGSRPQVQTTLKTSAVDLNRLGELGVAPWKAPEPKGAIVPPMAVAPPPAAPPKSIEDLIERATEEGVSPRKPPTAVRGYTRRTGDDWSVEPITAVGLRLVDVDARVDMAGLIWREIKAGAAQTTLALKDGVLKVNVSDVQLYGGRGKALISIDARQPMLVIGANVSGDGLQAESFFKDAIALDGLDGRARVNVAVSAQGGSERELVSTLAGKADMAVADGAVVGWNAQEMLGGLGKGRIPSLERNPSARTPFTELAGSMQIANGVGRTQDIRLRSAALEANGAGTVNIVDRNIDITVKPKVTGGAGLAGIELPVRIAGPWHDAKAIPDVNAALKSPQAQEAVRQIGKQIQNGDIDGALKSVLGNGPEAEEKAAKAKEVLKQLFRR
ncbi:MAG TPA: AsmA family protein [Hyphomicrobiaceae bacterium]|nr:AsmA family protein [Hyphomicrobiaceae bacterium]